MNMKKRLHALCTIICLISTLCGTAFADSIRVSINNNYLNMDVPPVIQNGRTLVPVRAIFEAIGANVSWDEKTRMVTATREGRVIKLVIDSINAEVDGKRVNLDVPAKIMDGRTMVPARFVAESLGAKVEWDDDSRTVKIGISGVSAGSIFKTVAEYSIPLQQVNHENKFTIKKPANWVIEETKGLWGASYGFIMRDPAKPARQIFYFGEIGSVFLNEETKYYTNLSVPNSGFGDWPVVDPCTPENFLGSFSEIANTQAVKQIIPGFPKLENLKIFYVSEKDSMFGFMDNPPSMEVSKTHFIGATFKDANGNPAEGLFAVTVLEQHPPTGYPFDYGLGTGISIVGITTPLGEMDMLRSSLLESAESFKFTQEFINTSIEKDRERAELLRNISSTISDTYDIINEGYENRQSSFDIQYNKGRDAILGLERVRDENGIVREVPLGWYEGYYLPNEGTFNKKYEKAEDNDAFLGIPLQLEE